MAFPGTVSKLSESVVASAAVITVKSDIVFITGSTEIATIHPGWSGFSQRVTLVAVDGAVVLATTGNILVGVSLTQNRGTQMVYSKRLGKWIIDLA